MTGVMINTVPRRVTLNPEDTVLQMLREEQAKQLEISNHESISLAELKSEGILLPEMFHTLLNFKNAVSTTTGGGNSSMKDLLFAQQRKGRLARYVVQWLIQRTAKNRSSDMTILW